MSWYFVVARNKTGGLDALLSSCFRRREAQEINIKNCNHIILKDDLLQINVDSQIVLLKIRMWLAQLA